MSELKAVITINKSFDVLRTFAKDWEVGDFKGFFTNEGEYLDRLGKVLQDKGKADEGFTITYTVTLRKEA